MSKPSRAIETLSLIAALIAYPFIALAVMIWDTLTDRINHHD